MARRMAEDRFRNEQWQHRYDEQIAPLNRLVDKLRCDSMLENLPYVAPMYGGVNARLLSVLRDPGTMTQANRGSDFLSMENNDATAEAVCEFFAAAGIEAADIVPWNAYPWFINRHPNAAELDAGVEPLKQVIDLIPGLRVIMLHGGAAHDGWRRLSRRYPNIVTQHGLHVIKTYHTSRQAFWHSDPVVREARRNHLRESFCEAALYLRP